MFFLAAKVVGGAALVGGVYWTGYLRWGARHSARYAGRLADDALDEASEGIQLLEVGRVNGHLAFRWGASLGRPPISSAPK